MLAASKDEFGLTDRYLIKGCRTPPSFSIATEPAPAANCRLEC
jgi:hypothetical protein